MQQDAEKGALAWDLETRVLGFWLTLWTQASSHSSVPPAPTQTWKGLLASLGFVLLVKLLPADTATGSQCGEEGGQGQCEGEDDNKVDVLESSFLTVLGTHMAQRYFGLGAEAADQVLGGIHIHTALVQLGCQPAIATAAEWIPL